MAFRTNKMPAIEERTVSGSSVSFNSAFALPLKACKVSFMATQAGSGEPSPSNPRAISGVSAIGLTANSTPVSVSLGDTRYGGYVDLISKKLFINAIGTSIGNHSWEYRNSYFICNDEFNDIEIPANNNVAPHALCEQFRPLAVNSSAYNYAIKISQGGRVWIKDDTNTDVTVFMSNYSSVKFVYYLNTPIEIDLSSIPDLSSIIGNNTFSTDTGTLEITFADLQEKSASGSVATFNTALAMPLVECKTEFMCTQEAGTPSPSNPLAITGVDSVAIQKSGQNIWNEQCEVGSLSNETGLPILANDRIRSVDYSPCLPNTRYFFVIPNENLRIYYYDDSYGFISYEGWWDSSRIIRTPVNCHYIKVLGSAAYGTTYNNDISINADSTDTAYHHYISNTVTLIDLDDTRYGGYVDVVRKKCYLTWYGIKLSNLSWARITSGVEYPYFRADFNDYKYVSNNSNIKCEVYKFNGSIGATGSTEGLNATSDGRLRIRDNSYSDRDTWLADVGNYIIAYELATSIEISLSDIPKLSTIIGNNSFASDSGSIELTYKDLDIAKRGNFREVFKLPS